MIAAIKTLYGIIFFAGWGAWSGGINKPNEPLHYPLKFERQVAN